MNEYIFLYEVFAKFIISVKILFNEGRLIAVISSWSFTSLLQAARDATIAYYWCTYATISLICRKIIKYMPYLYIDVNMGTKCSTSAQRSRIWTLTDNLSSLRYKSTAKLHFRKTFCSNPSVQKLHMKSHMSVRVLICGFGLSLRAGSFIF